jgi:hypothetical protein
MAYVIMWLLGLPLSAEGGTRDPSYFFRMAVLLHARTLKPIQAIPSKRFRASLEGLL